MLGVPSNLISTVHCLNYTSHGKTYSSSVLFCVSLHFFALRTEKLDVQEEVFAIAKKAFLFLHCFEFVK